MSNSILTIKSKYPSKQSCKFNKTGCMHPKNKKRFCIVVRHTRFGILKTCENYIPKEKYTNGLQGFTTVEEPQKSIKE